MTGTRLAFVVSMVVLLVGTMVQGAGVERFRLPVETAYGTVFTREEGIARASVYGEGPFSLYAAASHEGDQANATGIWETTTHVSGSGQARVTFRLSHTSGAQGIVWWGQLCCNAVATPYAITPAGERLEGAAVRLDGVPLDRGAAHLLQALDTVEGSPWVPDNVWEAAGSLAQAPEGQLGPAFGKLLQTLEGELALLVLMDALEQLGYLRAQDVEFTFPVDQEGAYRFGLRLETWACPVRPGGTLAWSMGKADWLELEMPAG